ncbi:MAG: hypothetical protein GY910_28445 [bacterium]|nr:hypothetical protein [Deltaproteobacteria bacterium]MCP4908926.1 hypothetical protein [bacterium]
MEKLIYLLGEAPPGTIPHSRRDLHDALLGAAPALEAAGAQRVSFGVADVTDSDAERVPQFNSSGLLDAQLSLWIDCLDEREHIESIVKELAPRMAGYLVTESILRDHVRRDWRSGEPCPGIALVTTFPKPRTLDDDTFYARWQGSHGPLSLALHPLQRYVRNAVARALTSGAPPIRAIVSETVASAAIAADPEQFYGGRGNRKRAVKDLLSFAELDSMSTIVMSETILST